MSCEESRERYFQSSRSVESIPSWGGFKKDVGLKGWADFEQKVSGGRTVFQMEKLFKAKALREGSIQQIQVMVSSY